MLGVGGYPDDHVTAPSLEVLGPVEALQGESTCEGLRPVPGTEAIPWRCWLGLSLLLPYLDPRGSESLSLSHWDLRDNWMPCTCDWWSRTHTAEEEGRSTW